MLIVVSHPRIATRYTSLRRLIVPERFFLVSVVPRRLSIVPRKQNVKSEDVIKESLEASWDASSVWTRNLWFSRQPPLIIPPLSLCLRLPFPIRLARSFHLSLSFSSSFSSSLEETPRFRLSTLACSYVSSLLPTALELDKNDTPRYHTCRKVSLEWH